jgi:NADH:ubiquinone oxidoreductase subunit B-like Fe-S oxidoreductase
MNHPVNESHANGAPSRRRPATIAMLMVVLIVAFYLLREHWGHVSGLWPYLLLMACPLMHMFHGHGGHGDHARHESHGPDKPVSGS